MLDTVAERAGFQETRNGKGTTAEEDRNASSAAQLQYMDFRCRNRPHLFSAAIRTFLVSDHGDLLASRPNRRRKAYEMLALIGYSPPQLIILRLHMILK